MVIYRNNEKYYEYEYKNEEEFENDIKKNAILFFEEKSVYIDAKKKIKSEVLGNTIPDGFLIDLSEEDNPEFYIVEVELYKHDFYSHIFPQITKFFAFYKNSESRRKLVDKLYKIVNEDENIKSKIIKLSNQEELYKYLLDMIENSQNILLIIDGEKKELPSIMNTYTDTWGKMVKLQVIKKYIKNENELFTMEPEFEAVEYPLEKNVEEVSEEKLDISEEFHLENKDNIVKEIYYELKDSMLEYNSELTINPQKYYISVINERNVLFFKFRKKKIRIVIMLPENKIKEKINSFKVKSLSESVQNFYNGECAAIDIEAKKNLDEILELVKPLIENKQK